MSDKEKKAMQGAYEMLKLALDTTLGIIRSDHDAEMDALAELSILCDNASQTAKALYLKRWKETI